MGLESAPLWPESQSPCNVFYLFLRGSVNHKKPRKEKLKPNPDLNKNTIKNASVSKKSCFKLLLIKKQLHSPPCSSSMTRVLMPASLLYSHRRTKEAEIKETSERPRGKPPFIFHPPPSSSFRNAILMFGRQRGNCGV